MEGKILKNIDCKLGNRSEEINEKQTNKINTGLMKRQCNDHGLYCLVCCFCFCFVCLLRHVSRSSE